MRALLPVLLAAALLLPGCAQLRGPGSDAQLRVSSWSLVPGAEGARIVGEVVNDGPSNAEALRIVVRFLAPNGTTLGTGEAPAWRAMLEPGESSAFDVAAPAGTANASFEPLGETTRQGSWEKQSLETRDVAAKADASGSHVTFQGMVHNGGDLAVVETEAQLLFRGANGTVVGVARAMPADAAIRAGESSAFVGNATLAAPYVRIDAVAITLAQPT